MLIALLWMLNFSWCSSEVNSNEVTNFVNSSGASLTPIGVVMDVRNSFSARRGQSQQREYILNLGKSAGLRSNDILAVHRRLYVSGPPGVKDLDPELVTVGFLKISVVFSGFSIAKEVQIVRSPSSFIDNMYIMRGDLVQKTPKKWNSSQAKYP